MDNHFGEGGVYFTIVVDLYWYSCIYFFLFRGKYGPFPASPSSCADDLDIEDANNAAEEAEIARHTADAAQTDQDHRQRFSDLKERHIQGDASGGEEDEAHAAPNMPAFGEGEPKLKAPAKKKRKKKPVAPEGPPPAHIPRAAPQKRDPYLRPPAHPCTTVGHPNYVPPQASSDEEAITCTGAGIGSAVLNEFPPLGGSESGPNASLKKGASVPAFAEEARGTPKEWNFLHGIEIKHEVWKKKRNFERFPDKPGMQADPLRVIRQFLKTRPGPKDENLFEKLGPPLRHDDGWFCFEWLPERGDWEMDLPSAWEIAWHGCKVEALYSIMYHGRLFESRKKNEGDRILDDLPGVYVHQDKARHKAEGYCRWKDLCGDQVFWATMWQVLVDRKQAKKPKRRTDQWVQPEGSVRLTALWLCGRTAEQMQEGTHVDQKWIPTNEAHPVHAAIRASTSCDPRAVEGRM